MVPNKNQEILRVLQGQIGSADYSRWQFYRWTHYDSIRLDGAVQTDLSFFVNPQGAQDPVSASAKTKNETNLNKSRSFGQTYFLLESPRCGLRLLPKPLQPAAISGDADFILSTMNDVTTQLAKLMENGVLKVTFGSRAYFEIPVPFKHAPLGVGLDVYQHAAVGNTTNGFFSSYLQGGSSKRDIYQLTPVQLIEPEQNVEVSIEFPDGSPATLTNSVAGAATPRINAEMWFDGYIARPIQ